MALVSHSPATAQESQGAEGKAKGPPKELALDLGQGVKLEMLLIPAGEFLMGSPAADKTARDDEKPQHRVSITRPFYLGKYLVTQQQWQAVMGSNPSEFKGPRNPVDSVGWEDCREFLKHQTYSAGNFQGARYSGCASRAASSSPTIFSANGSKRIARPSFSDRLANTSGTSTLQW